MIVGLGIYLYFETAARSRAESVGDLYGESALGELAVSLDSMERSMHECRYVTSPRLMASLCAKAAANASSALTAFGALPYSTHELETMTRYINGSGDYMLWLAAEAGGGSLPDEHGLAVLNRLSDTVTKLAAEIAQMDADVQSGALGMDEYGSGADDGAEGTVGSELRRVEADLPEFPAIEYGGQFSSSNADTQAKLLAGRGSVTEGEAAQVAAGFLGVGRASLQSGGLSDCGVPCWGFSVSDADGVERYVSVTEQGGVVIAMSSSHSPKFESLTQEETLGLAEEFLASRGLDGMICLAAQSGGIRATFTFAYQSADGVVCTPDAISVTVSLETGEVCGYSAEEYVMNHRERSFDAPAVSSEAALAALPASLTAAESRLSLLSSDSGAEVLCWEIACSTAGGDGVAVYVNAQTGVQEKIEIAQS